MDEPADVVGESNEFGMDEGTAPLVNENVGRL